MTAAGGVNAIAQRAVKLNAEIARGDVRLLKQCRKVRLNADAASIDVESGGRGDKLVAFNVHMVGFGRSKVQEVQRLGHMRAGAPSLVVVDGRGVRTGGEAVAGRSRGGCGRIGGKRARAKHPQSNKCKNPFHAISSQSW